MSPPSLVRMSTAVRWVAVDNERDSVVGFCVFVVTSCSNITQPELGKESRTREPYYESNNNFICVDFGRY